MATWQQSINSGGFLAGIGAQNENAPKASDVNETLAYIRQNNEDARLGRNNIGLQALQGITSTMQGLQQYDQQKQEAAFRKDYASAIQSGDRQQVRDLMTKYPGQLEKIQSGMKWADEDQRNSIGTLAAGARLAASSPEAMQSWLQNNAKELARVGVDPNNVAQMYQQNPSGFGEFVDHLGMAALGPIDYFNVQDKMAGREIDRGRLAETIRSNQAGEALTARGQNITMRGQDLSASTARRGQDLAMQRASTRGTAGNDERTVQLSDGRTVTVGGKLHGAGANAFYEGIDDNGNMVRVPASAIAAPPTSAASAQNYAMKKDIDAIANADASALDFMTGMTGGAGNPAIGADVRSRLTGKEQRQLYNSAQRIQGRMQNQGVAAARDMGASGINTIAEAKMYFQGMPQVDYSSPEAMQQSIREIQEYTNNYNQQYNVNVDNGGQKSSRQQPATQQSVGGSYTSKSGIQFTVE
ncbi:DNA transfer protein [Salmonella enterica subsp. enterica serovar Schwarzengrund]|nr:DNA transfer protein [Salmonella enterica]EBK1452645.1 DNA transfer protein [Salmonella enterica subsp. enterica serovar Schwarzengrund]EDT7063469.1 DNA transfer protein [Salmonella enterica subsp. enterica]EKG8145492.1 phage DNA ejection protein [Salmonella enterica subsp. enterica serovar Pomona]ELP8246513.1 phage DNA ejection protein [Salmonella enterica subsp. enterica serovar Lexington]QVC44730.1 phage DNA ejection protein [Salmonella enterica subsp. enterica serovar Montevideo str. 44